MFGQGVREGAASFQITTNLSNHPFEPLVFGLLDQGIEAGDKWQAGADQGGQLPAENDQVFGADPFKARKLLQKGKIVIITGGTGEAFCTHDSAAVLRALEIKADILLKATDVDGVYSTDPQTDPNAKKYTTLSYQEALEKRLQVMDQTAFALAEENRLPILVFKFEKGALADILENPSKGTVIS